MKIKAFGYLDFPRHVILGDKFSLYIHGEKVYEKDIHFSDIITCWGYVEILGGGGYFVGDDRLLSTLQRLERATNDIP